MALDIYKTFMLLYDSERLSRGVIDSERGITIRDWLISAVIWW